MSQGQESNSQAMQDVDHTRHSGMLTESYHSLARLVYHTLVVEQPYILQGKLKIHLIIFFLINIKLNCLIIFLNIAIAYHNFEKKIVILFGIQVAHITKILILQ